MGLQGGMYNMEIDGEEMVVGGDIILSVQGNKIENMEDYLDLRETLKDLKENDQLKLQVMRAGKIIDLNYTIPQRH